MSKIPHEEVKSSAIKFDLCNLKLELDGMLEKLEGDAVALREFHNLLSDALENCSQALAEIDATKRPKRRIPHD